MPKSGIDRVGTLRVAIVSPTFGGYGGLEAFVLALCEGLPLDAGLDVRVFFKRTRSFVAAPELTHAVSGLGSRVAFLDRGSCDLWKAISWAQMVHVQNPIPDAMLFAAILGRPVLVNVINHRVPGSSLHQRIWDRFLRKAERRFYISDFVRRTWEGTAAWKNSSVVFPICRLGGQPSRPEARKGFVFIARWIPNKGVDTLIEAYSQAKLDPDQWPLTLIGDGPLRPAIARRVVELGLRGVVMPGFVDEEAKVSAIRSARFLVAPPNTGEDFGLTAIEARHLHVPCIVTRDGGLPEAAGRDAIVCEPGDVGALARALRTAVSIPEADYAVLSERVYRTLIPDLAHPADYAETYRALAGAN